MSISNQRPLVIAHRGGRACTPENTKAAFEHALSSGCDGIELDVQRCASGELVVFHDPDLSRTSNGAGLVTDATLPELKRLSVGSWYDKEFVGEKIQTLEEVLALVDGKALIIVEIKNTPTRQDGIEDDLLSVLSTYHHLDKIIVSSFDHLFVRRLHELNPEIPKALLAGCTFWNLPEYAEQLGATFWHPKFLDMVDESVKVAHDAGLKVNAWTVNDPRDWRMAIKWGIDGIVTDDPDTLLALLARQFSAQIDAT